MAMSSSAPLRPGARGLVTGRAAVVLVFLGAAASAWTLLGRHPPAQQSAPAVSASLNDGNTSPPSAPSSPPQPASQPETSQPATSQTAAPQREVAQPGSSQSQADPASSAVADLSRHLHASADLSVRKLTANAADKASASGVLPPTQATAPKATPPKTVEPEAVEPAVVETVPGPKPPDLPTGSADQAAPPRIDAAQQPAAPALALAEPAQQPPRPGRETAASPSFDIVRVDPQGSAVLAGRSRPGAQIVIADNGRPIAQTQADAQGQWVAVPASPLPAGGQQLTLSTLPEDPRGAVQTSAAPVVVIVPGPGTAGSGVPPGPLALLTPDAGMPRLLQTPAFPAGSKLQLGIVDYDARGAIRFSGTAPPHSTVRVYIDRHVAGDAAADAQGRWTLVPVAPVSEGHHQLRTDQLARNGKVAARIALPFERVVLPDMSLLEGKIIVQPGESLWRIARHVYGQGLRYTVIYVANRSQIRNPDLIYPGQVFAVPADSAANPTSASYNTSR